MRIDTMPKTPPAPPDTDYLLCEHICDRLRAVLRADQEAVTAILEARYTCSPRVETNSPAVPYREDDAAPLLLGALGLINALVTPHWRIVAKYDDTGKVVDFTYRRPE